MGKLKQSAGLILFLALWEIVARSGWIEERYFPTVTAIVRSMVAELSSEKFLGQLMATWSRALGGLALAIVIAIVLAILAGRSRVVRRMLAPIVDMLRVLPPPAIVPLSIFVFGLGPRLHLFIVTFAAIWPIYVSAANALSAPEPVQVAGARSFGYGDWEILLRVRLPAAMPEIFTGIRVGSGFALLGAIAAEMLAASDGLGALLYDAGFTLRTTDMFAIMFIVGVSGVLLNALIAGIRHLMIGWHVRLSGMAAH